MDACEWVSDHGQMTNTVLVYNMVLDIFDKIFYEINDSDSENIKKSP